VIDSSHPADLPSILGCRPEEGHAAVSTLFVTSEWLVLPVCDEDEHWPPCACVVRVGAVTNLPVELVKGAVSIDQGVMVRLDVGLFVLEFNDVHVAIKRGQIPAPDLDA